MSEEERRKQRRNKKERGGSLFSLRKKKDKKDGKGLAKAGSAVSLQGSRTVSGPRMPQHSYSMSSLKRYPGPGHPGPPGNANSGSSQFYLARSESRYVNSRQPLYEYNDIDREKPFKRLPESNRIVLHNGYTNTMSLL